MSVTPRRLIGLVVAVVLAALAPLAPAAAAPPGSLSPADEATVETLRPTFGWSAATPRLLGPAIDRYEVRLEPDGRVVAAVDAPGTSAVAAVDLADDTELAWYVVAIDAEGAQESVRHRLTIATRPPAPAIVAGPAGPTATSRPAFGWSGSRAGSAWAVLDGAGAVVQEGTVGSGAGEATVGPLADGAYAFRVVQRNLAGRDGDPAIRAFQVDTVAPGALTVTADQATTSSAPTRTFSWTGLEPLAQAEWRVIGVGGAMVQGPVATAASRASLAPVAPGSYVFEVRQVDPAGNAAPWSPAPFAVLPPPARTAAGPPGGMALPARNWKRLKPGRGARIATRRPVLRWTRGPARTTFYNVQLFRVRADGRVRKVHSAFPRRTRMRVAARARLARGACYVWRVWPFVGSSATPQPLGISHFCVRR